MKKVITICLLVVAVFAGGLTTDAKTTKKKSKARTSQNGGQTGSSSLGIMTFCNKGDQYSGPQGKSANEIINALKKLGFEYIGSTITTSQLYDDYDDEYYDVTSKVEDYSKNGIMVSIYIRMDDDEEDLNNWPYYVYLMFDSATQENNFIATVKANGFIGQSDYDGTAYYSRKQPSGVSVKKTEGADEMIQIFFFDSH